MKKIGKGKVLRKKHFLRSKIKIGMKRSLGMQVAERVSHRREDEAAVEVNGNRVQNNPYSRGLVVHLSSLTESHGAF